MRQRITTTTTSHAFIIVPLMVAAGLSVAVSTPLDDYVNKPDSHYRYEPLTEIHQENYTVHILNMTSQKWMNENYSSQAIWWHHVCIVVPKQIKVKDTAFLLVDSGHNNDKVPELQDPFLAIVILIAVSTQTIGVTVKQVPNQPIVFWSDPSRRKRSEDHLLAWAWKEYLINPDQPYALVQLPMAKAVVRAMDTVDDYSKKIRDQPINKFFITGASKRGWTTWVTGVLDPRVIGIAPLVYDLLNVVKAVHHHYRSLGGWSFVFKSYFEANITSHFDSHAFQKMDNIVDPLVYKDRFKVPTYIVKATGDEYFLLDETMFYYSQLKQPHFLRFYLHLLHGATYPKMSWTMQSKRTWGSIRVTMDREPLAVIIRDAHTLTDGRRDFRLFIRDPKNPDKHMFHPVLWFESPATKLGPMEYEARVTSPVKGWRAFFIEVTFKGVDGSVLVFTTEVNVVPDTLPFPDCRGTNCTGTLV